MLCARGDSGPALWPDIHVALYRSERLCLAAAWLPVDPAAHPRGNGCLALADAASDVGHAHDVHLLADAMGQHVVGDHRRRHPVGLMFLGLPADRLALKFGQLTREAAAPGLQRREQAGRPCHSVALAPVAALGWPAGDPYRTAQPVLRERLADQPGVGGRAANASMLTSLAPTSMASSTARRAHWSEV
jgi:hypothetical protein